MRHRRYKKIIAMIMLVLMIYCLGDGCELFSIPDKEFLPSIVCRSMDLATPANDIVMMNSAQDTQWPKLITTPTKDAFYQKILSLTPRFYQGSYLSLI